MFDEAREQIAKIAKRKVSRKPPKKKETWTPQWDSYNKLDFRLVSVKCVEETDEVGSDEILLGGSAVGSFGDHVKVAPFLVGNAFDKGDVRPFPSPLSGKFDAKDPTKGKVLATFDLKNHGAKGYGAPGRQYALSLVMGEQDSGGGLLRHGQRHLGRGR